MQTESVLQTKNRSGPAKNRFSVALYNGTDKKTQHVLYRYSSKCMFIFYNYMYGMIIQGSNMIFYALTFAGPERGVETRA